MSKNNLRKRKIFKFQKEKPNYACIFLTRDGGNYDLWRLEWIQGIISEDIVNEMKDGVYYYLAWLDDAGMEWDEITECNFDEYLVLEKLDTMEEVHKKWCTLINTNKKV